MTFTVNVLFTCIIYCDAGPGYDKNSNEDMILALAGQFKQLSHEPEKFSGS